MGINGLLPVVRPICERKHIDTFAQRRVGIDASGWLHRGAFGCATELVTGSPTRRYIDYCMHRVRMLIHFGAIPVMVFDGAPLPMKARTNAKRKENREDARKSGHAALARGDRAAAQDCFQRATEITHDMVRELIKELRKLNVEYFVAPYEADAQLAWLAANGQVDVVVTEDSDLIVYGASNVFYKLSKFGEGELFQAKNLPALDDPDLRNFSPQMITWVCVLSGCDFFGGVPGLGVRKAHALVKRIRNISRLLHVIRYDTRYAVSADFSDDFYRACLVFKHQTVYDCKTHENVHLTELDATARVVVPEYIFASSGSQCNQLDFLGRIHDTATAKGIAVGVIHPTTLAEIPEPLDAVMRAPAPRAPAPRTSAAQIGLSRFVSSAKSSAYRQTRNVQPRPRAASYFAAAGTKPSLFGPSLFSRSRSSHITSSQAVRGPFCAPKRLRSDVGNADPPSKHSKLRKMTSSSPMRHGSTFARASVKLAMPQALTSASKKRQRTLVELCNNNNVPADSEVCKQSKSSPSPSHDEEAPQSPRSNVSADGDQADMCPSSPDAEACTQFAAAELESDADCDAEHVPVTASANAAIDPACDSVNDVISGRSCTAVKLDSRDQYKRSFVNLSDTRTTRHPVKSLCPRVTSPFFADRRLTLPLRSDQSDADQNDAAQNQVKANASVYQHDSAHNENQNTNSQSLFDHLDTFKRVAQALPRHPRSI